MKRFGLGSLVSILLIAQIPALSASPNAVTTGPAEARLLAVMKLWGDVKFFDPEVAGGALDWDTSFMNAEPAILSSVTPAEYRAAVASLIAPLHDPATHVNAKTPDSQMRITVESVGTAAVITIPHGLVVDGASFAADAAHAVDVASKDRDVLIDVRGVSESSDSDADVLNFLFSNESPLMGLVTGEVKLPRWRSRSYLGYPNQAGGYEGYTASDWTPDATILTGKARDPHRLGFLVDGSTSLPSMAIALARSGASPILTTGGNPAALSPSEGTIDLSDGVSVTYRTGELDNIDSRRPVASRTVAGIREAVAALDEPSPPAPKYASPPTEMPKDNPYADQRFPGEAMRMLAISRIYNIIRYFSPYTTLMHDDWDAAALAAIRDERAATDARSHVLALMKFYAHLHDSHGYVGGDIVSTEFGAGLPFLARYLHGQAVVTGVSRQNASLRGLRVGDIIDAVNGVPVRQAMNAIERYICPSTPQAADYSALRTSMGPSIFAGKIGTSITLRFHRPRSQNAVTETFVRGFYPVNALRSGPKYMVLAGNVGYVDFDRLEPSEVDATFNALKSTRAIVFDNRGYPRGTFALVAARLTTARSLRAALFSTPFVVEPLDGQIGDIRPLPTYHEFYQMLDAANGSKYLKPTVMLIDERTISQSEHSALFLAAAGHTLFVGTPTQGANGDVTSMIAPGAVTLNFTGEGVRHADGSQLQRLGIIPNVRVQPTASDIARGNDVVLQEGLAEALRLAGAGGAQRTAAVTQEAARERVAFTAAPSSAPLDVKGSEEKPLDLPWAVKGAGYSASASASGGYMGASEISLLGSSGVAATFGSYAAQIDLARYRGKTVRIRGYLRTENVTGGAGFWLRIDGPNRQFDNMQDRWLTGTADWKQFAIVLRAPADATGAFAGLLLVGTGAVHASRLTIDLVPDATPTTGD